MLYKKLNNSQLLGQSAFFLSSELSSLNSETDSPDSGLFSHEFLNSGKNVYDIPNRKKRINIYKCFWSIIDFHIHNIKYAKKLDFTWMGMFFEFTITLPKCGYFILDIVKNTIMHK